MSIADYYGKRKKREPQMPDNSPPPNFMRPDKIVSVPTPAPATRYRSEAAAKVAQEWEDLQAELRDSKAQYQREVDQLRTEIAELKGRLVTFEAANSILNTETELLRTQRDNNKALFDAHKAKLAVVMTILIELHKEAPPSPEQSEAALSAVEDALNHKSN